MGSVRVHVVMAAEERARYRAAAERAGQNLSEWLRDAAEQRADEQASRRRIRTTEDLQAFFDEIDAYHEEHGTGPEPDWEQTKQELADDIDRRTASSW